MEHIKIITIGRQYGSGGRIIGKRIAEELGFDFYDKALIDKISEECGYKKKYVEQDKLRR